MSLQDIQEQFPGFPKPRSDRYGRARVVISDTYLRNESSSDTIFGPTTSTPKIFLSLKDVEHVEIGLIDEILDEVTIYYHNDLKWDTDEFAQKMAGTLNVHGEWTQVGDNDWENGHRYMNCQGFQIDVGLTKRNAFLPHYPWIAGEPHPYVGLNDLELSKIVGTRREEEERSKYLKEEERKKAFRP